MTPKLSIILVNYNRQKLLSACLASIYRDLRGEKLLKDVEIIVVDNGSDESVSSLKQEYPHIKIIRNKENRGFAKANNQGMRMARGDYFLLLNTDTIINKHILSPILREMDFDKTIGVMGLCLHNSDGSVQDSAGYFPRLFQVFKWMFFLDIILGKLGIFTKPYHLKESNRYKVPQYLDWVSGAFFLFRKEIWIETGGFDENIFMYGEEVEWCFRIKKLGYNVVYNPRYCLIHLGGGSSIGKDAGIVPEYKSIVYFYKKHMSKWQIPFIEFLLITGALLRIVIFAIIRPYRSRISLYAQAIKMVR